MEDEEMKTQKRVTVGKGMWVDDGWVYRKPTFKERIKRWDEPICMGRREKTDKPLVVEDSYKYNFNLP
jgi:hypothetical protein